jgi:hypothetical protein
MRRIIKRPRRGIPFRAWMVFFFRERVSPPPCPVPLVCTYPLEGRVLLLSHTLLPTEYTLAE